MPAGAIPKQEREYKKMRDKEDARRSIGQQRSERAEIRERKEKGK